MSGANTMQKSRFEKENEVSLAQETAWVQQASQGDADALINLYERYIDQIYRYFHRRVRSVTAAETLTSEAFTRAIKALVCGQYQWQDKSFGSHLYDIAATVLQERKRELRNTPASEKLNDIFELYDLESEKEEQNALWQLVEELPEVERSVIIMRHAYDLPYAEIAKHLKCSEDACEQLHYQTIKKLKRQAQERNLWSEITSDEFEGK